MLYKQEFFQGARGKVKTRRQFLILDGKKIIAFLENGKKITDCMGNLTDVTDKVTCKVSEEITIVSALINVLHRPSQEQPK